MYKAILTIDDAPTRITPAIIDYLRSKDIVPVINFIGAAVDEHFSEAVYTAKSGIVIGNHAFSHEHFSALTLEQCRDEIQKTEQQINRVYDAAGVRRGYRVFRFPYGDKGGDNEAQIQRMLKDEFRFDRLDDSAVSVPLWKENHLDTNIDMHWSFDFVEYELAWHNGFTWDDIIAHIHCENPVQGCRLLDDESTNIILMHDNEATEDFMAGYYRKLIDYVLSCGVEFIRPQFTAPKQI